MNPSRILIALLGLPATSVLAEEPQKVPLWANGAPGFEARRGEAELAKDYWVRNIHNPSITVFLPPKEKATGAAVLICPGGGHRELVFNAEGVDAARYLNSIGVAAFALKYRLGRERGTPYNVQKHAREDGVRAMRLVRSRAQEWGIDPGRVGIMGFSAGGEVASMVAFGPGDGDEKAADPVDRLGSRPDFLVMIYPGPLGIPDVLPPKPPPAFLIVANDDRGASRVIASLFQKYRNARAPVEAHIFARGGHGFTMGKRSKLATLKSWPQRLADWMADNEILTPAKKTPAAKSSQTEPAARMTVTGRVLDPNGKPVPGATITIYARSTAPGPGPALSRLSQFPIGDARADGSGRFRIDAPRTSSSRYDRFGAIALAPSHGAGWVELDPDDDQPTADITLLPEQVIHGRLFDLQGQPVPNVTLAVAVIRRILPSGQAGARSRLDGVVYSWTKINDVPAWPRPVMTDAEGRFTLRGLGRGLDAWLTVHHPRFALQRIEIQADATSESRSMTAALMPAQIVTGRVTYADTGEGVPHAPLEVESSHGRVGTPAEFKTDAEGRFRVIPPPADHWVSVRAYPPEGQPYLIAQKGFDWPKGAVEQSVDLALPRGVLIRGKVTEEGSGKPVPGAIVDFATYAERQTNKKQGIVIETAADGSFQLGADSGPGHLFVKGPGDDYVLRETSGRMMERGQPGESRVYSHAFRFLDLKPDIDSQEVNVVLRPGATVTGQVVGPDGQPVYHAWIFSRVILNPRQGAWHIWIGRHHGNVNTGRFEIHGLDPDTEIPVSFLDPKGKLGGVVKLSGKSATGGPVTVRLEPCGAAKARVVGPGGKPVVGRLPRHFIQMIVTPGISFSTYDKTGLSAADHDDLNQVDTVNYATEPTSDAEGRVTFPALIPSATYRIQDTSDEDGKQLRKTFTVKAGETLDQGDIRIEKPEA
jgi:acetyl esterase/lipase